MIEHSSGYGWNHRFRLVTSILLGNGFLEQDPSIHETVWFVDSRVHHFEVEST